MADGKLAVLTPWYPAPNKPFGGSFVQAYVQAVRGLFAQVDVFHTEEWSMPATGYVAKVLPRMFGDLAGRQPTRQAAWPHTTDGVALSRIPVPVVPRRPWADLTRSHQRSLTAALAAGRNGRGRGSVRIEADVVHGHVGLPGGWLATQLAEPGARVFVTEHASFLAGQFAQPEARDMYDQVIDRSTAFFCVSELLRNQILERFPHHAGKVHVVPNAVGFERIPPRPEPVTDLRRWIFVGALMENKGVRWLLEAFAVCAMDRDDLELTLVGGGPLTEALTARAEQLGLADRVHMVGPVPPEQVFDYFHRSDLLVHPSRRETFGMTTIEALASGMPVLVTRCGGPEETLRGIEDHAGELVGVGDGVVEIVRGYRELRTRMKDLDLARARTELEQRFGHAAVARQLGAYYFGGHDSGHDSGRTAAPSTEDR
jgi:glycogen(starch) synthase